MNKPGGNEVVFDDILRVPDCAQQRVYDRNKEIVFCIIQNIQVFFARCYRCFLLCFRTAALR